MNPTGGITLGEPAIPKAREQCVELAQTVKVRIAPSRVHGVGVVAIRDMKAGERAYCSLFGKPVWYQVSLKDLKRHLKDYPEIIQLILDRWPNVVNGKPFLNPNYDARLISFMNHSNTPNYSPVTDTLLTDVKADEELFEDYRLMPNYNLAYPWLA